ncbi:hypothetical protein TeGR_g7776, partial [Tetraparma gracilis]
MLMMDRSKEGYDIAVLEVTSQRRLSVKVKAFDLRYDWNGAQLVHHKNMNAPYIVVVPMRGNPIKISVPTLQEVESVHSAIRRVIKADTSRRGQHGAPQHDLAGTGSMDNTETFGSNAAQHAT